LRNLISSKSFIVSVFLSLCIIAGFLYNPRQRHDHYANELGYDIYGYYIYLPLTFIYKDIKLQKKEDYGKVFDRYQPSPTFYQVYKIENGNFVMNYTCGFAMLYSPFFFIANIWAQHSHTYPPDGHSFPYHICIALGVLLFYVIPGIFILRKALLHFFNETITTVTLLLIVLGTNYFNEAINGYLGPHAILFTGYSLLLLLTIKWHEKPSNKTATHLGLLCGMMILSRPSELLCLLIPLLWNVWDKKSWNEKWIKISNHKSQLIIFSLCAFLTTIPQIIYWKMVTGSWIFNSYQNTEGFDFLQPHFLNVLFSFKKSWFVYTPIIIFPIVGIFLLRKYNKQIYLSILIFFLTNFYVLGSKSGWWEGGSYGLRYFVESYAVMALPFGYVVQNISGLKNILRWLLSGVLILLIALNLFQTWQYLVAIIPADRMTFPYYKAIFLKTRVTDEDRKLMEVERSYSHIEMPFNPDDYKKRTIAYYNFETINTSYVDPIHLDSSHYLSPPYSCRLDSSFIYSPGISIPYQNLTRNDHAWIRATLHYFPVYDLKDNNACLVFHFQHKSHSYKYAAYNLALFPYHLNDWNTISINYMTPYPYSESDILKVYVWLQGNKPLYIDDLHIECFEKK